MGFMWVTYEFYMSCIWVLYEVCMCNVGMYMGHIWVCIWVCIWVIYGSHMVIYGGSG